MITESVFHKMCSKGEQNTFCADQILHRFQKTIKILPCSLCHLPHTDVRMSMTQQGNFFVVLFYLFLDNEKSAEGLAWGLLLHTFAHETLPQPYGSSVGGYLTHQKNQS